MREQPVVIKSVNRLSCDGPVRPRGLAKPEYLRAGSRLEPRLVCRYGGRGFYLAVKCSERSEAEQCFERSILQPAVDRGDQIGREINAVRVTRCDIVKGE